MYLAFMQHRHCVVTIPRKVLDRDVLARVLLNYPFDVLTDMTPAKIYGLMESGYAERLNLSRSTLRGMLFSGAPLKAESQKRIKELFGLQFVAQVYGLTESGENTRMSEALGAAGELLDEVFRLVDTGLVNPAFE